MRWQSALFIGVCALVVVAIYRRATRLRMEWKNATEQIVKLRQDSESYAELKASLSTSASARQLVVINTGTVEGSLGMLDEGTPSMPLGFTDVPGVAGAEFVRSRVDHGDYLVEPLNFEREDD